MGTRSSHGFRFDGKDYLTYNQFDGYPTGVGLTILKDLKGVSIERMVELVPQLILVDERETWQNDLVTPEDLKIIKEYSDENVSTGNDWYSRLRNAQGTIAPYFAENPLRFMAENSQFVFQGDCEFAYIVNLDNLTVEFYRGYNSKNINSGRYTEQVPGSVYFIGSVAIALIQDLSESEIEEFCDKLESYVDEISCGHIKIGENPSLFSRSIQQLK